MKKGSLILIGLLTIVQLVIAEEKAICDYIWYFSQNSGIEGNVELGNTGEIRVKLESSKDKATDNDLAKSENGQSFYILPTDPSIDRFYGLLLTASAKEKPVELWYTEVDGRRIVTKLFYYNNGLDIPNLPYDPR